MAETLLALFLVTSSAKGSSLVYRWPPSPESQPRLARPRPKDTIQPSVLADNPWKAANQFDGDPSTILTDHTLPDDDDDYIWPRSAERDRSKSFSHPASHPSSGRASPTQDIVDNSFDGSDNGARKNHYDDLLGYSAEFLAGLLCPKRSLCHQKFELIVDNLVFIGHPVCSEKDGVWRFKTEKSKTRSRGRGSRQSSASQRQDESVPSPSKPDEDGHSSSTDFTPSASSWLQIFHFVLVLDLPDPSSSASGNVSKYFDIIYENIAFTVTAVLFQEQVLSNFVETECDLLGSLRDDYVAKGKVICSKI
jgi:nitrogen permease regulator 3-like protein